MEQKTITISEIEEKGNRSRCNTDKGWMTCWEDDIREELRLCIGTMTVVMTEHSKDGKWENIKSIVSKTEIIGKPADNKTFAKAPSNNSDGKNTTMYTSYAKDIFCTLREQKEIIGDNKLLMDQSIELVKQAKEAF